MPVEQKIDFLSLLKRRKETFETWLLKTSVRSYADFCKILKAMNAEMVDEYIFDEKIKNITPSEPVLVKEEVPPQKEGVNLVEEQEINKPKIKFTRKKKEPELI